MMRWCALGAAGAVVVSSVLLISAFLPAATDDDIPQIGIYTDKETYAQGDTIEVSISVQNDGPGMAVAVYVGLLTPAGRIFTLGPWGWSPSIEPWLADLFLPASFTIPPTPFWWFDVPCNTPPIGLAGAYYFATGIADQETQEWIGDIALAPFEITATGLPTAFIDEVSPNPATQGLDSVSFVGHGEDPDGTVERHQWDSDLDGTLSTEESFERPAGELSQGLHIISYGVMDNDGNWSLPVTDVLSIRPPDTTPTAFIDSIWPWAATQGEDTVEFVGHGEDWDGTIEAYRWNSNLAGLLSDEQRFTKAADELALGYHTIFFVVQDNDGLWSRAVTGVVLIEPANVAPTAYIDAVYPNPATQGEDLVLFMGHGVDTDGSVEGYKWQSDRDGLLSEEKDFDMPASELQAALHAISYEVMDNDGEWSLPVTEALLIYGENQAPTAHIDSISPNPAKIGEDFVQFQGHGEDVDGLVDAHEWRSDLDGFLNSRQSFAINASFLTEGTHSISYKVKDDDGVWSTPTTATLSIVAPL